MPSQPGLYFRGIAQFHLGNQDGATIKVASFGNGGNDGVPVVGDWDGTGTDKPGLYFRDLAQLHLGDFNGATTKIVPFGNGGNDGVPVVGDWGSFVASNFTFDADITPAQRNTLLERHQFAFSRISACGNLNANERQSLTQAYQRAIRHSSLSEPGVNARSTVGGSHISVNFGVLFPQGDTEIAQTLIHEMMHSAGFTHPDRRDPPTGMSCAAPNPAIFDCPFDSGQYFGTPPLRAELCIAGSQDDIMLRVLAKARDESCSIDSNGVATLRVV